ncbi:AraC family transcriptional regulator [Mucilaginibacter psychrotolerans]|uniref:AraC family transcriptional regulator n=1 Tax=Mucilaginibacter psychrotolerans TaxID=1524096 RepID=A0A4Y8RZ31_9SPHI|nr:AraC family transcriptional regulator [Mucilaginibacter psychrotolerans]TFF30444.1 AraC family transcriptional regulator [Mucilaginibacter psychrotolerans]
MKPVLEYLPGNSGESFVTKFFDYNYYPTPWHFHPEYELVLVTESTGKRYIGDQISDFRPGDLALIGPYLPHTYKNDPQYFEALSTLRAKSIVVHFKEDSFSENFFTLPEAQKIAALLARSVKGLAVKGKTNGAISEKMHMLIDAQGLTRWLLLLDILNVLSESKDLVYICKGIITGQNQMETMRMNKIIDFVIKNFNREILLSEASDLANMTQNSFSRYFSQRTRKSFTSFVNEVRLSQASKLLIETAKSVTEICLACGFNNLSNFNRQFKQIYHINPVKFRKSFINQ